MNMNEYEVTYIYKPTHEVVTKTLHPINDTTYIYAITKALNDAEDIDKILSVKELNPKGLYAVQYKGWIQDTFETHEEAMNIIKAEIEFCKKWGYKFHTRDWKIKYFPQVESIEEE
jgi:hypothetical protein